MGKLRHLCGEELLKEEQIGKKFQQKMGVHCEVTYDEGVKWFGCVERSEEKERSPTHPNRRSIIIDSLVKERRALRRRLRSANTETETEGFKVLLKVLAVRLMKFRRAEKRRQKQRVKEAEGAV